MQVNFLGFLSGEFFIEDEISLKGRTSLNQKNDGEKMDGKMMDGFLGFLSSEYFIEDDVPQKGKDKFSWTPFQ